MITEGHKLYKAIYKAWASDNRARRFTYRKVAYISIDNGAQFNLADGELSMESTYSSSISEPAQEKAKPAKKKEVNAESNEEKGNAQ